MHIVKYATSLFLWNVGCQGGAVDTSHDSRAEGHRLKFQL